jgi:hypothetical protein
VGGDGVEAVMNVTGVLSARVLAQAGRKGQGTAAYWREPSG